MTKRAGQITVRRLAAAAVAGMLTAAVAVGVAEIAAAVTGPRGAPILAVGETAINLTPVPVKEFAIARFGTHDEDALIAGIAVALAAFSALVGVLAARRIWHGLAGLAAFGCVGAAAALSLPGATAADVVPTLAGVGAGAAALIVLARAVQAAPQGERAAPGAGPAVTRQGERAVPGAEPAAVPGGEPGASPGGGDRAGRRGFLIAGAGAAALAVVSGGTGYALLSRFSVASERAGVRLPAPAVPAPAVRAGTDLRIPGLTPFFTPDASFYRVDTDLVLPQVSPRSWTLRVDGMA